MSVFDLLRRGHRVSKYERQQRLDICELCPDRKGPICGICGCALAGKTRLDTEECPLAKWPTTAQ